MNEALNFVGIIKKSGNLLVGYNSCEKAIKSNKKIYLVILAHDVSDNTFDLFERLSKAKDFKIIRYFDKKSLGKILGKEEIGVIGIRDKNLTNSILNIINSRGDE